MLRSSRRSFIGITTLMAVSACVMLFAYTFFFVELDMFTSMVRASNRSKTAAADRNRDVGTSNETQPAFKLRNGMDHGPLQISSCSSHGKHSSSWTLAPNGSTNLLYFPPSLLRYAKKHHNARKCYKYPHSKFCRKPLLKQFQRSAIIWERPPYRTCCGIGDRISSIIFVFALAVASDRPFFVSWMDAHTQFPLELTLSPSLIDWRIPTDLPTSRLKSGLRNWAKGRHVKLSIDNVTRPDGTRASLISDSLDDILGDAEVVRLYSRFSLLKDARMFRQNPFLKSNLPDLADLSRDGLIMARVMFQALFRVSQLIEERAMKLTPPKPFIAAHIRTGKDARESIGRFSWASNFTTIEIVSTIFKCSRQLFHDFILVNDTQSSVSRQQMHFFIASDSLEVKYVAIEYSRLRNIIVHSILRKSAHLWTDESDASNRSFSKVLRGTVKAPSYWVQENHSLPVSNTMCDAYLDIFTDVAILARASAFVTTGSRLSDMAYFLGRNVKMFKMRQKDSPSSRCSMLQASGWTGY